MSITSAILSLVKHKSEWLHKAQGTNGSEAVGALCIKLVRFCNKERQFQYTARIETAFFSALTVWNYGTHPFS